LDGLRRIGGQRQCARCVARVFRASTRESSRNCNRSDPECAEGFDCRHIAIGKLRGGQKRAWLSGESRRRARPRREPRSRSSLNRAMIAGPRCTRVSMLRRAGTARFWFSLEVGGDVFGNGGRLAAARVRQCGAASGRGGAAGAQQGKCGYVCAWCGCSVPPVLDAVSGRRLLRVSPSACARSTRRAGVAATTSSARLAGHSVPHPAKRARSLVCPNHNLEPPLTPPECLGDQLVGPDARGRIVGVRRQHHFVRARLFGRTFDGGAHAFRCAYDLHAPKLGDTR